jgi:prolyl-tRNA editing enzyme YbaK/EbsC (Cys-tRNA(Pro) deacylase)
VPADPRVLAALGAAGLAFEILDCDPALADTAEFCRAYGVALEESANTIVVASRQPPGHSAACVALASTRIDVNGSVRRRRGVRKLSFASAEATRDLTGMEIGGVTVAGLPDGLPIWVDAAVAATPSVVIGGGSRSAKIRLAGPDLARLPGVEVVEGLAGP